MRHPAVLAANFHDEMCGTRNRLKTDQNFEGDRFSATPRFGQRGEGLIGHLPKPNAVRVGRNSELSGFFRPLILRRFWFKNSETHGAGEPLLSDFGIWPGRRLDPTGRMVGQEVLGRVMIVTFEQRMRMGREAQDSLDFEAAIQHFLSAYEMAPDKASTCVALGRAYRHAGNLPEAWRFLKRGAELNPKLDYVWHECGITAKNEGDTRAALYFCLEAIKWSKNELHKARLVQYLIDIGEYNCGIGIAESLTPLAAESLPVWQAKVLAATFLRNPYKIIEVCDNALRAFPEQNAIRIILVNALIDTGELDRAQFENELVRNSGRADIYVDHRKNRISYQNTIRLKIGAEENTNVIFSEVEKFVFSMGWNIRPDLLSRYMLTYDTLSFKELRCLSAAFAFAGSNTTALLLARLSYLNSPARISGKTVDVLLNALMNLDHTSPGTLANLRNQTSKSPSSIPKVIIQFWDFEIPEDVLKVTETWKSANPSHEHIVFDRMSAYHFIECEIGKTYADAFEYAHHPAMKSDLFRLCYIFVKGGIYVDADESCFVPIDQWLKNDTIDLLLSVRSGPDRYIHNWFIAARPAHPLIELTMRMAFDRVIDAMKDGRKCVIWEDTGPGILSLAFFGWFARNWGDVDFRQQLSRLCLLPDKAYRYLTRWRVDLDYRKTAAGNWRMLYNAEET